MSRSWKDLEKKTAAALGGTRVNRANDYGASDVDVLLNDFPFLRVDCKYRKRHAHHSLVEEIRTKYCKQKGQYPVLVTKHHSGRGEFVAVDLVLFAALLQLIRRYDDESRGLPTRSNEIVPSKDGSLS